MMQQAAFLAALHLLGALFMSLSGRGLPFAFSCLSGLVWGQGLCVATALLLIMTGLPYTAGSLFGSLGTLTVLLAIVHLVRRTLSAQQWGGLILSTALVAAAAFAAGRYNFAVASFDSYAQMRLAQAFAVHGGIDSTVHSAIASWGVFLLLMQSTAIFLRLEYLWALGPVNMLVFACTFGWLQARCLRVLGTPARLSAALSVLTIAFVATTYFMLFNVFYIHNSLLSMVYLSVGVVSLWMFFASRQTAWLLPGTICLICVALLRIEAPLVGLIFAAILVAGRDVSYRARLLVAVSYSAALLVWYGVLLSIIGKGTEILTPHRAYVIMAAIAAFAAVTAASRWSHVARLMRWVPMTVLVTLSAAVAASAIAKPEHTSKSIQALFRNLVETGNWGHAWGIIGVGLLIALALPRLPHGQLFSIGLPSYAFMIVGMGMFRVPYRIGWGDSGNRMLTHIVPLVVLFLAMKAGQAAAGSSRVAPSPGRQGKRTATVLVALAAVVAILVSTHARNLAEDATVLEAPPTTESHSFSAAVDHTSDTDYFASSSFGPATIVFKLAERTHARLLTMQEYSAENRMVDYAWHISKDGRWWREVFDTRCRPLRGVWHSDELTTHFELDDSRLEYVRLTFRAGLGQNRLLLRSVRVDSAFPIHLWNAASGPAGCGHFASSCELAPSTSPAASSSGQQRDRACGATLLSGPLFLPGHHFHLALSGEPSRVHPESAEEGPGEIILDLARTERAGCIVLCEVPDIPKLTDIAVATADHIGNWVTAFDSHLPHMFTRHKTAGLSTRIDVRDLPPFRYVRLQYRGLTAGDRFQLGQMHVWTQLIPFFEVVEAPAFSAGHDFDQALRYDAGLSSRNYVASAGQGPCTVVLDAGGLVKADAMEWVEYHPSEAMTDYAWQISTDREHWTDILDTRDPRDSDLELIDATTRRISLPDEGAFRYVRLVMRASKGQNRLLLRRLSFVNAWMLTDEVSRANRESGTPAGQPANE